MAFRERVLKTLILCLDRKENGHCEISQLNQFTESDLEGQKKLFFSAAA